MIDEQHRFGVEQRATLRAKGADGDPDLLVMTATPIPRTAAMVIFGDLDLTTLDELPPGRVPVTTEWLPGEGHRRPGARLGAGARRRWRRVTGPSSSARWSASRCGSRPSRPPRSTSAWRRASWPGSGSGSCTGRWRRRPARR